VNTAESHAGPDDLPQPQDQHEDDGRRRIGEIFVELGFITSPQLEAALDVQREKGGRIGEILVAQGSLTRLDLASALAEHWEPHHFAVPETGRGRGRGPSLVGQNQAGVAELERRLHSMGERLGAIEASAGVRGTSMAQERGSNELQERLAHVEELRDGLSALDLRVATLEQGLDQLDARPESDAVARGARTGTMQEAFEQRLERIEGRPDVVAALEEGLDALDLRLKALEASARSGAAELAERLRAQEEDTARLREELASLRRDVEEGRAGSERTASSLKLETGSLGARIDELRGLRSGDSQELRRATEQLSARADDLVRRLDAHVATHEEHVAATERALLDGLTAVRTAVAALEAQKAEKKAKKKDRRGHDDAPPEL
jgi:chromosome segregation ATPase